MRISWMSAAAALVLFSACTGEVGPVGPAGAMGDPGAMGAPGDDGTDGADGMNGTDGTDGVDGVDATAPAVLEPYHDVYGLSRAEWAEEWWTWVGSIPSGENHPLMDASGASCGEGQTGPVFFLGGTLATAPTDTGERGEANRVCTVDHTQLLFFPLLNVLVHNIGEAEPISDEDLVGSPGFLLSGVDSLVLEIDGEPVEDLERFLVQTDAFDLPYVANSVWAPEAEGGTTRAADGGYYVMLRPLPAGTHRVHFGGSVVLTEAVHGFDFTFELDINYDLTVE